MEPERSAEQVERDRERGRADDATECILQGRAVFLRGCVDVQLIALLEQRLEERNALHVVPVEMRDEGGATELLTAELLTEVADAGAHVENDGLCSLGLDGHARGVPAVASRCRTMARRGSTHAVKRHCELRVPHAENATHRSPIGKQSIGVTVVAPDATTVSAMASPITTSTVTANGVD